MSDTKDLLERVGDRFDFPPDAFDRLEHRRDRKERNRRIRAGAVGLAIAIAVAWLGISVLRSTSAVPADDPTETPTVRVDDPAGGSAPTPYRFLDGAVTFAATDPPWRLATLDPDMILHGGDYNGIRFLADPRPVGTGCEVSPAAADAESMAAIVRSDPDIQASDPVPVRISGTDGVQMDVAAAPGASLCAQSGATLFKVAGISPGSWGAYLGLNSRWKYRLYLLDVPGSSRIVAIVVFAPDRLFDGLMQAAAPVLGSLHFHAE